MNKGTLLYRTDGMESTPVIINSDLVSYVEPCRQAPGSEEKTRVVFSSGSTIIVKENFMEIWRELWGRG